LRDGPAQTIKLVMAGQQSDPYPFALAEWAKPDDF
jgi:hypothetical protein